MKNRRWGVAMWYGIRRLVTIGCLLSALCAYAPASSADGWEAWESGDYQRAVAQWRPLAERGDPDAQFMTGLAYSLGKGVSTDPVQAVEWFRKSAQQGHLPALDLLATAYARGHGVQQDYPRAVALFRQAAEHGYAPSQGLLGVMYRDGRGVKEDSVTAFMWLDLAASQGDSRAAQHRDALANRMSAAQINVARQRAAEWSAAFPSDTSPNKQ